MTEQPPTSKESSEPEKKSPEPKEKSPILSFEEFIQPEEHGEWGALPRYNNFILYWVERAENYQKQPHYQKFAAEHPDLNEVLRAEIKEQRNRGAGFSNDTELNLYEAYKIMRDYGATDKDLFS